MRLSELKSILKEQNTLTINLPNGKQVPPHFHVTEVGQVNKKFIDCGGTLRQETKVNFQLWEANDYHHRLKAYKLLDIIELSEKELHLVDAEIEVEYQGSTIGKYGLEFNGNNFVLTSTSTDCLALDQCSIIPKKKKISLASLNSNSCTPGSGCC